MNLRMERGVLWVRCEEEPENNGEIKKERERKETGIKKKRSRRWVGLVRLLLSWKFLHKSPKGDGDNSISKTVFKNKRHLVNQVQLMGGL